MAPQSEPMQAAAATRAPSERAHRLTAFPATSLDQLGETTMKIASIVSAIISSAAPFAFAESATDLDSHAPVVDYHYGMQLDVASVLHRTDNSDKTGVVSSVMVYRDSLGEVHKVRFLEWGGRASNQNG